MLAQQDHAEAIVYRAIEDFERDWAYERDATLKVLKQLTDTSLNQVVTPGGRSLGRLAWHLVVTLHEMGTQSGLEVAGPPPGAPQPGAAEICADYQRASSSVAESVTGQWTDEMLADAIPMYGESWPRGKVLAALVFHQAHHRGQMTVLMRQAGLVVPGVYGPAREEWAAMGMPAQE